MNSKSLIVIAGPTGVGKTDIAIMLARRWNTEIVSADSRQIFAEMEIGTAKPTPDQQAAVPHHFVGTQSIQTTYDAGQYGREALQKIQTLFQYHDRLILSGGSGLYISAVIDGFDEMPEVASGVREKIVEAYEAHGLEWLQEQVRQKDPEYFNTVDQRNPQRLVRALELFDSTGKTMSGLRRKKKLQHDFAVKKIGLVLDRVQLYERIDARVDQMIARGLEEEARTLYADRHLNAMQTVGYSEWFGYFDGAYDRMEAIRLLKRNTRNYAKRQLTWFRRDPEMHWFQPDQFDELVKFTEDKR